MLSMARYILIFSLFVISNNIFAQDDFSDEDSASKKQH